MTIVAADGYLTKPLVVSCLDINLGQRCAATEAQSPRVRVACNSVRRLLLSQSVQAAEWCAHRHAPFLWHSCCT